MRQARPKAKTTAIKRSQWLEKLSRKHDSLPAISKLFCVKSPVFWVLAFYIIKGTAVTVGALAALYFGLFQ